MKTYWYLVILALCIVACGEEENRDTLEFRDHTELVESKIMEMEKMLVFIPNQVNKDEYQSYCIKDNHLFINNEMLFDIRKPNKKVLVEDLKFPAAAADSFISTSGYLFKNRIDGAINQCIGWGFFYKLSSDRGQYRLIKVLHNNLEQDMENCHMDIIDKKGVLGLFKFKELVPFSGTR